MTRDELDAVNQRTLEALRRSPPGEVDYEAYPYFGYYTVDIFDCPPFLMFTNNDCHRARNILYHRKFEPMSMKLWCRLARGASGIIDIGAQVGVYSLAAAALRQDIPVHAFEPNPHAIARLRVHCKVNGFDNVVQYNLALGHDKGTIGFSWSKKPGLPISSGGQVGARDQLGEGVERTVVTMTTFDQTAAAAALGPHALIKIDVEGAEHLVFQGMSNALQHKPDIILETFSPKNTDYINGLLQPLGYRTYLIQESGALVARDKLHPCSVQGSDFNQFLSVRSHDEIMAALN